MKLFDDVVKKFKDNFVFADGEDYDDTDYEDENDEYDDEEDEEQDTITYDYSKPVENLAPPAYKAKAPVEPSYNSSKQGANIYKMNSARASGKIKVTLFVLEDLDDARNVADCMKENNVVTVADMTKLPTESVRRVLDFLDGVKYVCKAKIEVIAERIYIIVPESTELTGDFFRQIEKAAKF